MQRIPPARPSARRPAWLRWLRGGPWRATVIWALCTLLSASLWLLAVPLVMVFDAPGSEQNPWLWLLVIGVLSLPLLCALTPALLWGVYGLGCAAPLWRPWLRGLGHGLQALPLVSPLSALVGLIGLQLFCGGRFDCHG